MDMYNTQILKLALPAIVTNVTVPLLGLVDTAIVGHMGEAAYMAAIAVGSMIFNLVYWVFGFLRMGTSGLTAQAWGRHDRVEVMRLLARSALVSLAVALLMAGCGNGEQQLKERAAELCKYIPDHELREESREYMTEDFYNVLDTMFNLLPEFEAMDHEWLYYFVTGNGGTIADFEVTGVEQQDKTHAVATICVRQKWEDGSFDPSSDIEEHRLYMEKVDGRWLISDFDEHKADCIRHIAINPRDIRQTL